MKPSYVIVDITQLRESRVQVCERVPGLGLCCKSDDLAERQLAWNFFRKSSVVVALQQWANAFRDIVRIRRGFPVYVISYQPVMAVVVG